MADYQYDVAVLGGGPGGYVAAIKAAQNGLKVALIEKKFLGGTCLNVGCIPTKALLASADAYRSARSARDFGITVEGVSFDFAKIMARKERVVKQLRSGVEFLMKKNAITVYSAAGSLTGTHTIGIANEQQEEISANYMVLASGSTPSRPPIPGLDGKNVVTSDEILFWPEVPSTLTVIGGGAIGLEFAFFFNSLGCKVTLLEGMAHILPLEDEQIAAELANSLKRQGIKIQADAMVKEIGDADGQKTVSYEVRGQEDKGLQQVTADVVLVATGRTPFTAGCGYDAQGITIERRAVKVDEYLYTGVANIYAIGDLIGGALLAHKASAEAAVAIDNILGHRRPMEYHAIPTALYSSPEVAGVGMNEAAARAAGIDVNIGTFPFRVIGKSVASGVREGMVKMVVDKATGVLIGCQAIGPHVTDLIADATMAVQNRLSAEQFAHTIHPHPTFVEAFHEAIEVALGHPVHV
ncbi:MAG TPA: dihydrolipoyl dehydrogenase [Armatimonadota bacterium]|nr:dihydrolipoyl dehydrogenase [Armatimonadota bacterium]